MLQRDKKYNEKIDVWSLGCLLYRIFTCEVPFIADSIKDLLIKIKKGLHINDNMVTQIPIEAQDLIEGLL